MHIAIIGAGLAGSLTAAVLEEAGHTTTIIDDRDRFSASAASSNLYIASWLKRFDKRASRGIDIIERLFGEHVNQPFDKGIAQAAQVKHLGQEYILRSPNVLGKVLSISEQGTVRVEGRTSLLVASDAVVVCAGWRAQQLIPDHPEVEIKVGHAYLFEGTLPKGQSTLSIIGPYKHQKLYQYSENLIYYADSVALKYKSYCKRREEVKERTLERSDKLGLSRDAIREFRVGYRPLIKGADFGICQQFGPNLYSINGGGKNGLVAYACAAEQLLGML